MKPIHKRTFILCGLIFFVTILLIPSPACFAKDAPYVPDPLKPWVDWVLHHQKSQLNCIPEYNNAQELHCNWPARLDIKLDRQGGRFQQSWQVFQDSWVALPGNNRHWPTGITVNGAPAIVMQKSDTPQVQLPPGLHMIKGSFNWSKLPEHLQIPPQTALVTLTVENEKTPFPNVDDTGRLWLKATAQEEKIENRLKIESHRLIEDMIPPKIQVHITLDVAGAAREITLGPIYTSDKVTPISLTSPLPARLEENGNMRVQVRPGRYDFTLTLRHTGPLESLSFSAQKNRLWPNQEIWSFAAHPNLRLVEIEGPPSIDPLQTSLPKQWQRYPAYRVLPDDVMVFKEIKRGDPEPAPDQLTLDRTLWLRFDGSGYTIQDVIEGQKNTNWRLEMAPGINLGRVAVDGEEQFITKRKGAENAGVELRKGTLNLTADSAYQGTIASLPATGWDHDFQQVHGKLHLPPGWKLLSAGGIDNIPRTWIKRWTLLDIFIVLIFTIAVAKLFSKPLAGIAFVTLVLIYHEPNAPRYIWLALLVGFSLLKHLPDGKFKQAIHIYQWLAMTGLVVIAIPYGIQALRIGIYPQLEKPWSSMTEHSLRQTTRAPQRVVPDEHVLMEQSDGRQMERSFKEAAPKAKGPVTSLVPKAGTAYDRSRVMQFDPKAVTQTGPGMPKWQPFDTFHFNWSGPVTRGHEISLALIGPKTNLGLAFIRVFLIILLALGMFGIKYQPGKGLQLKTILFLLPLFTLCFLFPCIGNANDIPSQGMLNELRSRLLEKETCFPNCADISNVNITISPENLTIVTHVDAQVDTAIPLPSHVKHWLPQQVLLDNQPAKGLFRTQGSLWALIPAGKHVFTLMGRVRKQNTLQLPLPLKPHHAEINAMGWSVEGLHSDGTLDAQLQFKRIVDPGDAPAEILETGILPSFVIVERNLLLGLVWKIKTSIKRVSPAGSAIILSIPLLPGESVTTEGVRVQNGHAQVNLKADQSRLKWDSFLEPSDSMTLKHSETNEWTEIWNIDVSPIYHMTYEGIPVILHQRGNRWYPTWHPWPGEEVRLSISRPAGINGQSLTIERSHLTLRPGQRTSAAELSLTLKSSQGGQHTISLPANGELQEVKLDGQVQPIRQEGRRVPLPVRPGIQTIDLKWRESEGIKTRYTTSLVDLGAPSVNASVDVHLSRNRWPLFMSGEQLVGPAVLFWSVLFVVILVAFGLSKTGRTPLRFYQWLLLGIGMSMSNLAACLLVVGWLMALELKKKPLILNLEKGRYNLFQLAMGGLTILAMGALVFAISQGLLGHPDMNIVGNGSYSGLLRWYQDVSDTSLPQAWIVSIPMLAYRMAMLAWALWISFWLVGVLKWGWQQFITPNIWYASNKSNDVEKS